MKQYVVEVMEKFSHGVYGKRVFQVWGLSATSKKNACDFAYDIVAGMKWRDIFPSEYSDMAKETLLPYDVRYGKGLDETIGYERAENYFSYRAELNREAE